ncbi:alpha/beta hydrolase [Sphingobacterium puteale]|uniref:Alpha/beta hydrolase n=1 Tax=Sphingobacterium puteale TaxID=2420510 RepID=A0A420VVZ9_9SPHI|nr:alpha/beta hydrolase [Sphingobacterium puteale]RKO70524.1 alpha/beta hydrolase [Sphingobacterium puteale]
MKFSVLSYFILFFSLVVGLKSAYAQQTTYVIVHGAWGGAWQFKKTANELEKEGHRIYRPTLTGLGERYHLADTSIRLQTHINDVINTILFEDLTDIVLVGHSYGGMIITGVADSLPDRIKKLVYLDAILPDNQESVLSLMVKPDGDNGLLKFEKDGFIIPFWVKDERKFPRDVPHPLKTMTDKISLRNSERERIPATYILTYEEGKTMEKDDFYPFYAKAKQRHFKTVELIGDHNPQIKKLKELVDLLLQEK